MTPAPGHHTGLCASATVTEADVRKLPWCADLKDARHLPLFHEVERSCVDALLHGAVLRDFAPHTQLVQEGQPAEFLHIVMAGSLEVFASYRGREASLAVIGPGQSFILAAVLLDRPHLQAVRVLEPSRILLIPAGAIRQGFAEDGDLARALARDLALSYRTMVKELKNQTLRPGLERLANWLLAQDAKAGGVGRFHLPFEKRLLAARLGMAPEVLSRSFAALAVHRVAVRGASVTLGDRAALSRLAQPCPMIDDPGY